MTTEAMDTDVAAAVAGTTVTLTCTTNLSSDGQVRWNFRAVDSRELVVVHSGSEINPELRWRHAVVGLRRLVIVNVRLNDAGSYSCMLPARSAKLHTTQLIVVGELRSLFQTRRPSSG